jgi:hypothetical protein
MAEIATFLKGPANQALKHIGGHKVVAENVLDFSETNVASADVVNALKIPAGAVVTHVRTRVLTAEGGVATVDVGDAVDPNGWVAAADANAAANVIVGGGAFATNGKQYDSADTLDLIPSADLDTAVIHVSAEYFCAELPVS